MVPRSFLVACAAAVVAGVGLGTVTFGASGDPPPPAVLPLLAADGPAVRNEAVYYDAGVWVDAFDFDPAYTDGSPPPVAPSAVDDMAEAGVRTLYVQASRRDARSRGRLLAPERLGELLVRAHLRGIRVVGWYLPHFDDVAADLDRLYAIADFEVLGHRFDGIAVDIEDVNAVTEPGLRSARLVELSAALRRRLGADAIGAIVPPPVQLEVVNTRFWPTFPWRELDASYDVWLPMAYWTLRAPDSGYRDAYRYTEESIRRLRNNLGRPDAVVHPIGGIADLMTDADYGLFARAVADTGSVGASLYDWATIPEPQRARVEDIVPR